MPRASWRDYLTLTKPRIMVLLLITGAGGLVVGAGGVPSAGLALATLGGLALACGGASALNHVLDRDIDTHMKRTAARPVASGRVPPERALEFGLALSALSYVVLTSFVNVLAALLALAGNLFYVIVYTRWLKRSTPQNIVIGGAAGAVPPLVGYAAATGNLTLTALALFLIVFFWTPPHFWALALLIKRDYAAAGIPMLPVVRGERETARSIVLYSVVLVGVTLLPVLGRTLGPVYLVSAAVLGRGVRRAGTCAAAPDDASAGAPSLQLLPRVPCAPVRRHGRRPGARLRNGAGVDPELGRKNNRLGLLLLGVVLVLVAGSVAIAVIYDAVA